MEDSLAGFVSQYCISWVFMVVYLAGKNRKEKKGKSALGDTYSYSNSKQHQNDQKQLREQVTTTKHEKQYQRVI